MMHNNNFIYFLSSLLAEGRTKCTLLLVEGKIETAFLSEFFKKQDIHNVYICTVNDDVHSYVDEEKRTFNEILHSKNSFNEIIMSETADKTKLDDNDFNNVLDFLKKEEKNVKKDIIKKTAKSKFLKNNLLINVYGLVDRDQTDFDYFKNQKYFDKDNSHLIYTGASDFLSDLIKNYFNSFCNIVTKSEAISSYDLHLVFKKCFEFKLLNKAMMDAYPSDKTISDLFKTKDGELKILIDSKVAPTVSRNKIINIFENAKESNGFDWNSYFNLFGYPYYKLQRMLEGYYFNFLQPEYNDKILDGINKLYSGISTDVGDYIFNTIGDHSLFLFLKNQLNNLSFDENQLSHYVHEIISNDNYSKFELIGFVNELLIKIRMTTI